MRRNGFTLIEILLVVIIFALGAVLAGMAVYRRTDRMALHSSAQRLLQMARYAHLQAAEHHQECQLHIDISEGRYWLNAQQSGVPVSELAGDESEVDGILAEEFSRPSVLPTKVRFALVRTEDEDVTSGGETIICFAEDGSAEGGLVQLATEKGAITLLVYPWTGKAELRVGAIEELPSETLELAGQ